MYKYIDLNYIEENSFNDQEFKKSLLETSYSEFLKLKEEFKNLNDIEQFCSEKAFNLFHKFKPTAAIFKMHTYPSFKKYGSGDYRMEYFEYQSVINEIMEDLQHAAQDIQTELENF